MYTRQHASQMRQQFWTAFGQYMNPVNTAGGEKANWINYKTGIKHLYFRMQADSKRASIAIEITHPHAATRQLYFEQLSAMRNVLESITSEEWRWELNGADEHNNAISRIYKELNDVNLFDKENWPALISFFKPRIVALDEFWSYAKDVIEK